MTWRNNDREVARVKTSIGHDGGVDPRKKMRHTSVQIKRILQERLLSSYNSEKNIAKDTTGPRVHITSSYTNLDQISISES